MAAQQQAPPTATAQPAPKPKPEVPRRGLGSFHNSTVQVFAKTPGFGLERMLVVPRKVEDEYVFLSPGELELASPLANEPELLKTELNFKDYFAKPGKKKFFDPRLKGYVRLPLSATDPEAAKELGHAKMTTAWRIASINLVGLADPDQPLVYESRRLSRQVLKNRAKAKTYDEAEGANGLPQYARHINFFEEIGIKKLKQGQDLFIHGNEQGIHMLGALRSSRQCSSCHNCQDGELLGALSYTLRRQR